MSTIHFGEVPGIKVGQKFDSRKANEEQDIRIPTISIGKVFDNLSSKGYGVLFDNLVGQ